MAGFLLIAVGYGTPKKTFHYKKTTLETKSVSYGKAALYLPEYIHIAIAVAYCGAISNKRLLMAKEV